jgi:hypothetical protein
MCSLYCVGSGYYYVLLFLGKLSEEFYFLVVPQNSLCLSELSVLSFRKQSNFLVVPQNSLCLSELSVLSFRKQSNSLETTVGINILDCLFRVY